MTQRILVLYVVLESIDVVKSQLKQLEQDTNTAISLLDINELKDTKEQSIKIFEKKYN
jgi:hypothetical protein